MDNASDNASSVVADMRRTAAALLVFAVGACGSGTPQGAGGAGGASVGTGGSGAGGGAGSNGTGGAGAGGAGAGGTAGAAGGGSGGAAGSTGAGGSTGSGGAGGSAHDGGSSDTGGNDAPGACSAATTLVDCDALAGCHPVFFDPQTCGCASLGCCAHFMRCADGAVGQCQNPGLSCTIAQPHCEGPYVIGYSNGCYEGCVRLTDCAP